MSSESPRGQIRYPHWLHEAIMLSIVPVLAILLTAICLYTFLAGLGDFW